MPEGATAIHDAARCGHVPVLDCLLEAGADPDEVDHSSWTPLHLAAGRGLVDVVPAQSLPRAQRVLGTQ